MLYEIMKSIRNFFVKEVHEGTYEIKEGRISLPFLEDGDYFIIEGSKRNDEKVFQYSSELQMKNEKFDGRVIFITPPESFLNLVAEIEEYCKKYEANPYQSESFGGYSYSKATNNGHLATWQNAFGTRLNAWRKI